MRAGGNGTTTTTGGGTAATPRPSLLGAAAALGLAWAGLSGHGRRAARAANASAAPRDFSAPRGTPPEAAGATGHPDHDPAGRDAAGPTGIPARGWWAVLRRVLRETSKDNVSIVAAGCAFYAMLALFPAITALVSVYGLVADPAQVEGQLQALAGAMPENAFAIIKDQAHAVASAEETALGWGTALAIALALYSASAGVQTLFTALNIAYEEEESRGFLAFYATAYAFTLAAIVSVPVGLGTIVAVPTLIEYLPLGTAGEWAAKAASFALLFLLVACAIAAVYRFGPSRAPASWRWLTPGSLLATSLWIAASLAFSYYATNFGSYTETYGALAGVIILLFWLWISAYVILLGAELNAELELQTARDTTTGAPRPLGERSAYAADHTADMRAKAVSAGADAAAEHSPAGTAPAKAAG